MRTAFFLPTPTIIASPLVFLCPFTPSSKYHPHPHRIPPCPTSHRHHANASTKASQTSCHGVTPGLLYVFPTRLLFITFNTHPRQRPLPRSALHTPTNTQISRNFAHMSFCVSFFRSPRPAFRLHPPSSAPRHRLPPASGRHVSQHLFSWALLRVPKI